MSDDKKSGPQEAVRGVVEGAKGLAKEAVGGVLGKEDLEHEGKAQQDKAQAQRDAAKKEAKKEQAKPESATSAAPDASIPQAAGPKLNDKKK